jgi:hypothetical protein
VKTVRVGRHASFDRVVVTLRGSLPGYRVGYVHKLFFGGSGEEVDLRGPVSMSIVVQPVSNPGTGNGRFLSPDRRVFRLPEVREYRVLDFFEGTFGAGLGLRATRPFRVFTLTGPPRIVVDIQH